MKIKNGSRVVVYGTSLTGRCRLVSSGQATVEVVVHDEKGCRAVTLGRVALDDLETNMGSTRWCTREEVAEYQNRKETAS